jgi:hypothetical protein
LHAALPVSSKLDPAQAFGMRAHYVAEPREQLGRPLVTQTRRRPMTGSRLWSSRTCAHPWQTEISVVDHLHSTTPCYEAAFGSQLNGLACHQVLNPAGPAECCDATLAGARPRTQFVALTRCHDHPGAVGSWELGAPVVPCAREGLEDSEPCPGLETDGDGQAAASHPPLQRVPRRVRIRATTATARLNIVC